MLVGTFFYVKTISKPDSTHVKDLIIRMWFYNDKSSYVLYTEETAKTSSIKGNKT